MSKEKKATKLVALVCPVPKEHNCAFCEKDAAHNLSAGSHSRALIQVKIHRSTSAASRQQSRQRPPTPDGFTFVPHRAVFSDGIRWSIEPPGEATWGFTSSAFSDAQFDRGRIAPARSRSSYGLLITRVC